MSRRARTRPPATRGPPDRHNRRVTEEFRCAAASLRDAEPMVGTAPEDGAWLFVEDARPVGPQGRRREPTARGRPGVPRRPRGRPRAAGPPARRRLRTRCPRLRRPPRRPTPGLDDRARRRARPAGPRRRGAARRRRRDLTAYDAPLWLVCTNGRRDRCCAETGRPVAAALAGALAGGDLGDHAPGWPPLRRHPARAAVRRRPRAGSTPGSAVAACKELEAGRIPFDTVRGRAGLPGGRPGRRAAPAAAPMLTVWSSTDSTPSGCARWTATRSLLAAGDDDWAAEVGRTADRAAAAELRRPEDQAGLGVPTCRSWVQPSRVTPPRTQEDA